MITEKKKKNPSTFDSFGKDNIHLMGDKFSKTMQIIIQK